MTPEQVMNLTWEQGSNLSNPLVHELFAIGALTPPQAMLLPRLSCAQILALEDPDTRQRLINGTLTINQVLALEVKAQAPAPGMHINEAQSTHTASVHRTVSESAIRLMNRYGGALAGKGLDNTIQEIVTWANNLEERLKPATAKRGVQMLSNIEYAYTDAVSQVSTRQLLALAWLAIHHEGHRMGTLDDAQKQLIEGLYEIRRGYNLSASGEDKGGADVHICSGGTFNKLMEKLVGISPDVEYLLLRKNKRG